MNQEVHEVHARFVSSRIHNLQQRVDLKSYSVSCVTTLCRKKQKTTRYYVTIGVPVASNAQDRENHIYENEIASILTEFKKLPTIKIN